MQVLGHRVLAARLAQCLLQPGQRHLRQQIEVDQRLAIGLDGAADVGGKGVHQAAFDTAGGEDELTDAGRLAGQAEGDVFQRRPGEFFPEVFAPAGHLEAAVARFQRRHVDAARLQQRYPGAIRAQARPAAAAQCQQAGIADYGAFAVRSGDAQAAIGVPAQPAAAGVDGHAQFAQAAQPGAQQRRGLHVAGEHAAGGADEGVDTQAMNPLAQGIGVERAQQRRDLGLALAVTTDESVLGLGVGDVHATDTGQQELAPHRGHGVEQLHAHAALRQHFGSHQPGRAAADDGDVISVG